jgi:hypothetical protein
MFKTMKFILAAFAVATMLACGGGSGSGGGTGTPTATYLTITGTAATGLAIPVAIVTGKCKVGTGTASTLADGSYTLTVIDGQSPCVLQITNPVDGIKLHTVVTGIGSTAIANITPITEMVTARVLGFEPNVFFAAFDKSTVAQKLTSTAVQTAQTDVSLVLTDAIGLASVGDFISTPLRAATTTSPTNGDYYDKVLDKLKLKLTSKQIATLGATLVSTQSTDSIKQTVLNMTNVPVANAGKTQSFVIGSNMALDGSASRAATGKTLTYAWKLISKPAGSAATLSSATAIKPTFVADMAGSYAFSLIVNDGTSDSSAVNAVVTNAEPGSTKFLEINNGGITTRNYLVGQVVYLDASNSFDPDGQQLNYLWEITKKPGSSNAQLGAPSSAQTSFIADTLGTYEVNLQVGNSTMTVNAMPLTFNVTATDRDGPTFSFVSLSSNSVNVSLNDQELVAIFKIADATGFKTSNLGLSYAKKYYAPTVTRASSWKIISGDAKEAIYEFKTIIPAGSQPGQWLFSIGILADTLGNTGSEAYVNFNVE